VPPETDTGQERTIPATPRRREEARRKGQVAKSREVNSALMLLAGLAALSLLGPRLLQGIGETFGLFIAAPTYQNITGGEAVAVLLFILQRFFIILAPFLAIMVVVAVLVNILQVGFLMSSEALSPKWERIDPIAGLKRMFSKRSLMELLKSLLKIGVVGYVCYRTLRQAVPDLATLTDRSIGDIFAFLGDVGFKIGINAGIVLIVIAIIDYAFQRYEYEQSIKMTMQEFKQEMREMEGDPMVRARIRSVQREMARRRMMEAVPQAEVVVTNPTHYAVALQYRPEEMDAPRIVAKGQRLIAQKIREVALEHGIPIVEDPPLAQALFKSVDIGQPIPEKLYRAVAEVLAYVYRLNRTKKQLQTSLA
jgi:flagellar biosynthetic protein FlhB